MASTTGIELGPNTCLLTAVRRVPRGQAAPICALARIEPREWPHDPSALTDTLRTIRREHRFPRRASVIQWIAAEDSSHASTPATLSLVEAAGFQISSILSPAEALARLAIERRRGSPSQAIAWLALNTYGAAIAIVRDEEVLFSRTFPIRYKFDLPTSKAELLQRYLLISHVAPELSRGFALVREAHGLSVGLVVTCGDLPDLRSLTMPLIEELDMEVETMDSTEGLQAISRVSAAHVAALAPALRLAAAAAIEGGIRSNGARPTLAAVGRMVAAAAVVAALAWVGYFYWRVPKSNPVASSVSRVPDPASRVPDRASQIPDPAARIPDPAPRIPDPALRVPDTRTPTESVPQPVATGGSGEPNRAIPVMPDAPPEQSPTASSDKRTALQTGSAARLSEPLPKIETVLIDQDRRLAIANGVIVNVGDTIGSRVVIDIARDGVALREPSGRVVRVRP